MFIELHGQQVHAVDFGEGQPAIVGMPGSFGTTEIWQQPFELLSRKHRTISYDHFGTGSTYVPPELVTFDEQVAVLEALLDALSLDRCVLAGDSHMVAVAVEFAARHAERVQALALVAGGVVHHADELTVRFVAGLRSNFDRTADAFVKLCIPDDSTPHLRSWLRDIIRRTGGERAARLSEMFYGIDVSHRLPQLSMPSVVIQGQHDSFPSSNLDAAKAMVAAIPDCRLEVIQGSGHVPTLSRPDAVAAIIERLVEYSATTAS